MIREELISKDLEGSGLVITEIELRYCMERLRKTRKNIT
jgi:hypothetical protein